MRITFYAPMKAPHHPTPSGDRLIGRQLLAAISAAGHPVSLASSFRSRDGGGQAERQERIRRLGERLAERLLQSYDNQPAARRPELWFTYHLYHKAPDWLGPRVSRALNIPYVLAEASFAPKQANGAWAMGHEAVREAVSRADAVFSLNANDVDCLMPLLADTRRLVPLRPFLDLGEFRSTGDRQEIRAELARLYGLPDSEPWLIAVAMMRPGNKLDSYRLLAEALAALQNRAWRLLIVGDGSARVDVEAAFAGFPAKRVELAGALPGERVRWLLAACDLFVWPGVREPIGMSLLEAQAAGLPVIAGDTPGVAGIVRHGHTGRLVRRGDVAAFAAAVRALLDAPAERATLGRQARLWAFRNHDMDTASRTLDRVLVGLHRGCWP